MISNINYYVIPLSPDHDQRASYIYVYNIYTVTKSNSENKTKPTQLHLKKMIEFWPPTKTERELKKHRGDLIVLQRRLAAAHSDCNFYQSQTAAARSEAASARSEVVRLTLENTKMTQRISAMDEELRRVRNIPMQAEELLEEFRGECAELRGKVEDLNIHNVSLAEEIGRLRGQLTWRRGECDRARGALISGEIERWREKTLREREDRARAKAAR